MNTFLSCTALRPTHDMHDILHLQRLASFLLSIIVIWPLFYKILMIIQSISAPNQSNDQILLGRIALQDDHLIFESGTATTTTAGQCIFVDAFDGHCSFCDAATERLVHFVPCDM
ncbi:hypothetical protein BDR05DRAFT_300041 [Suillus weaverae]|nr:hypothetical protein BDR05DRAFT_300041 [Suillus weaverae]